MNIAIVTGASSGMGREFVLQLSKYVFVEILLLSMRHLLCFFFFLLQQKPTYYFL